MSAEARRGTGTRGQATVALLVLATLASACVLVLGALARSAVERAHAQRVADVAALAGAHVLAQGGAPAAAEAAARLAGLGAGAREVRVEAHGDGLELRVTLPGHRVGLPRLVGGGVVREAAVAVARAMPGAPRPAAGTALVPTALAAPLAAAAARAGVPPGLLAASIAAGEPLRAPSPEQAASAFAALVAPAPDPWAGYAGHASAPRLAGAAERLAAALRRARADAAAALAILADPRLAGRPPSAWPVAVSAYVRRALGLAAAAGAPSSARAAAHLVP